MKWSVLVFLVLGASPIWAGDKLAFATGEYAPYVSADLPQGGPAAVLVAAICQASGIEPLFSYYPWPRAEQQLRSGSSFGAFPYSRTPERAAEFDFSEPIYSVSNALVYYEGNAATPRAPVFRTWADLKTLRVGHLIGSFMEEPLRQAKVTTVKVGTLDQLVQMLRYDRIDLIAEDEASIEDSIRRQYPAETAAFHSLEKRIDEKRANHLMVSRKFPGASVFLARFNAGLAKLQATGEYLRLLANLHLAP